MGDFKKRARTLLILLAVVGLGTSFWRNDGWLELCAGLALFLFGMQCLEEGLRELAGGKLERLLARSTATPFKGLLFGLGGTMLLQSSTLVSLLTLAFISTGLVKLAGGIAILFGANLGSTTGIWLLALAGQNVSLSPLALPLLVFGVMAGLLHARGKAGGRILLGIASSSSASTRSRPASSPSAAGWTCPPTTPRAWAASCCSWPSARSPPWYCSPATPR